MRKILLALTLGLCMSCQSQTSTQPITSPPTEKTLVADETWIVASGKTGFRVICSNDTISHYLMRKFEDNGMTKFTYILKKDRHGNYWERSFYFKNESWNMVALYIKNRFK